jgi:hypothetical protein
MPSRNAKDISFKLIFDSNELFVEFLRDFVPVDLLKNVSADDIEDVTTNYPSLEHNEKSSDTVKKINLKRAVSADVPPLFVIALLEHQSTVNFRMPFKLLFYMTSIWASYEKEVEENGLISTAKNFKYPPILPLVFYDGGDKWTALTNFVDKVELSDMFSKYIPKFEYELIDLNRYNKDDLLEFGDMLSLVLLVDKVRKPQDMEVLSSLPKDYIKNLTLNIPESLKTLLSDVIRALLQKINVPKEEIEIVTETISQRRSNTMFDWSGLDGYDVQETRRQVREETQYEERQKYEQKSAQKERAIADYLRSQGLNDDIIKGALSVQAN